MIVTPFTDEPTHKTVWDLRPNGNVFPGLTVWDVHKNRNVFLGLTVCDIHTNGNVFLGFTVWDVHTYRNDWVSMPHPIAHELICCPRRAYPRRFLGCVGRTPYRTRSLGDGSKRRLGKGLKTICIAPRCTSEIFVI